MCVCVYVGERDKERVGREGGRGENRRRGERAGEMYVGRRASRSRKERRKGERMVEWKEKETGRK